MRPGCRPSLAIGGGADTGDVDPSAWMNGQRARRCRGLNAAATRAWIGDCQFGARPMGATSRTLCCEFRARRAVHNGAGQRAPARPIGGERIAMYDRWPSSDSCAALTVIIGIVLAARAMGHSRDLGPSAIPLGLAVGSALPRNSGALPAVPDDRGHGPLPFRVGGTMARRRSARSRRPGIRRHADRCRL